MSSRFLFSERRKKGTPNIIRKRITFVAVLLALPLLGIVIRLFQLQIVDAKTYSILASDQHEVEQVLVPKRGTIYLRDRWDGTLQPIAKDEDVWQVYLVTREIKDDQQTAEDLAQILGTPVPELEQIIASSTYAVLTKDASQETVDALNAKHIPGVGITKAQTRFYPEKGIGGQVLGFVNNDDENKRVGRYGLEASLQDELAGKYGSILLEKDAAGRRLTLGTTKLEEASDGSDLVLTLDRTIQYEACRQIREAVGKFQADSGSIVVLDLNSGAVWAMCSWPDFEPETYNTVDDISVFNNPVTFSQYEPGSVFKPVTISAGLNEKLINPDTTYVDKGEEHIDNFTIRDSDKQAHGVQTMTQVLEKSLNLGTIFVERLLGKERFKSYVEKFGFGKTTNIELAPEAKGDIRPLAKPGDIFAATASFGQGIAVTPMQLVTAYAALGNGGKLYRPYIIDEVHHPDGTTQKTQPEVVSQPISTRTSRLVSGMLVTVVENGHGAQAGVSGYYVAGKTGTAQIPDFKNGGYLTNGTIGSFAGYAPASDPKFVMLVKVDHPRTVQYAESSAAPVFGSMAKFLLSYLHVEPERPIIEKPLAPLPPLPTDATTTDPTP